jgi:type IV secretion/conjugal transfer VirB4 family ATPase
MEKSQAMGNLEKRRRNVQRQMKAAGHHAVEVESMREEIQADGITQFYTRFALEVFGKTPEGLETAVRNITKALEGHGFGMARETVNREGSFWSRFPGMEHCNSRLKETTSMSAPYSTTFANVGEGFSRCSWGKAPVHLKTLSGSVFSWTWHHSPAPKSLGNTLVIGGSEVGKTTLVNFLLDKCFQYPNFKVVSFDRLFGQQVWTECMGGSYIHNNDIQNQGINPLMMPDTPDNRVVLSNWTNMLTGPMSEDDKDALAKGLGQVLEDLPVKDRNLTELYAAVSTTSKEAAKRLRKWLPEGEWGTYFNGSHDALDFQGHQLVTFDMTKILDLKDVVGPLSYYIFCKVFQAMEGDGGYAVVIDELPKYLRNPDFKDHIPVLLQEIRKTDGIFISMVQSADHILRHEAAQAYLNNTASFLLFPEPRAMAEDYIKVLGLNEREFNWIKTTDPKSRQVLLKRRGGESVFLDVNLSHLGNLFKVYNSSTSAVGRMKRLKEEYADYVSRFLAS